MARITVEDCLKQIDNRFGLIHLAAKRVRQLRKGAEPLVTCKNKDIVTALREIAVGKVHTREDSEEAPRLDAREQLLLEGIPQPFSALAPAPEQPETLIEETMPEEPEEPEGTEAKE